MVVESADRGYQIEVVAFRVEDAWDADVRIRRTSSKAAACAGRLTCRKPTAKVAEERGPCARASGSIGTGELATRRS
jgi:hypothetical protein